MIEVVAAEQLRHGTHGGVGEIGIHHGRLFILLYLLARSEERAFAIDVFEAQHLNVDDSGAGDRGVFEAHLRRFDADFGRIDIIQQSSLEVTPGDIRAAVGPVRLFSIDGGHTTNIALNDLKLAEETLGDGGVVILDDAFQSLFPGVAAAVAHYLLGQPALLPFAVSPEKVLLTQPRHHQRLLEATVEGMGSIYVRREDYFGSEVAVIREHPKVQERLQLQFASTGFYQRVRRTPLAGSVVDAVRPLLLRCIGR